ncbi:tyrosine-type recombinase/integrase [Nonomuraea rhodomycinica]|uniref:Tyrosine-type recombinase/integrase n=1 Tax=Nonomuraea rhodomycinica TaxID=1712872 RepID=A0A7Y6IK10_9ACTN|nr:tyrosine-type recombinase/integrase [Nonomuraea rhodomycinica]NUW39581.1 tyrosine-type recombinase/integrase [Nonomuraea rhodomycinica]
MALAELPTPCLAQHRPDDLSVPVPRHIWGDVVIFTAATAARIGETSGVRVGDLDARRMAEVDHEPSARLFTGPRGGRSATAVLRDATHWDEVVTSLGFEHLRRHDLPHTGLTWMAEAGVPVRVLRKIAGHGLLSTTQRCLHPNTRSIPVQDRDGFPLVKRLAPVAHHVRTGA